MASSWGTSWGTSWADSWGAAAVPGGTRSAGSSKSDGGRRGQRFVVVPPQTLKPQPALEPVEFATVGGLAFALKLSARVAFTPNPPPRPTRRQLAEMREELWLLGLPEELAEEEAMCLLLN